ncbi:hypothetical protein [Actinoplanes sp. NPDC051494]|uniref:hypothetical protein n=1 Tax=Actinoplanes sp. NPDC051494 TaxID=3363907 RepID=UPI00379FBBCB
MHPESALPGLPEPPLTLARVLGLPAGITQLGERRWEAPDDDMTHHPDERSVLEEPCEHLGGKSSSLVSKRTDLVVCAGAGAGSKAQKAEELELRTMPAETFAQLLAAYTAGDQDAVDALLARR